MFYLKATRAGNGTTMVIQGYKTMDIINKTHKRGIHLHESTLRKTFKSLGVELIGTLKSYGGCLKAKVKGKAVPKITTTVVTYTGVCVYLDTTGPFVKPLLNGAKFDVKIVDQFSWKTWEYE
jgi:hypothetical protein